MFKRIPKAYIIGGGFIVPALVATLRYWSTNVDACIWAGFCVIAGGLMTSSMRLVDLLLDDLGKAVSVIHAMAQEIRALRKGD